MTPKARLLSKISIQAVKDDTEYADSQAINESIAALSAKYRIDLVKYLGDLARGEIDSVSVTKDKPYFYFFARRFEDSLSIAIKESDRIVEFTYPIAELERLVVH
jgi:hypothetical protein